MRARPFFLVVLGVGLLMFPFALAFFTSITTDGDLWNEGSGGGGALWLLFFTAPLALTSFLASLIWWLVRKLRKRRRSANS